MAIDSATKNIGDSDEVLIIDNGVESAVGIDVSDKRIRFHRLYPGCGVSVARNQGLFLAANRWVAFLDDDDLWPDEYLARIKKIIGSNAGNERVAAFITRKDRYDSDGRIYNYKTPTVESLSLPNLLTSNGCAGGSNLVVKKEVALRVGGFDRRLDRREDRVFVMDLLRSGYLVMPINSIGALTRDGHHGSEGRLNQNRGHNLLRDFVFYTRFASLMDADMRDDNLQSLFRRLKKIK